MNILFRLFFSIFNQNIVERVIVIAAICVILTGCVDMMLRYAGLHGSGGGAARGYVQPQQTPISSFSLEYENSISFDHDLTVSVDSVFARLKLKDQAAKDLVHDFIRPGYRMFAEKYGIHLPDSQPVPVYENAKFVLTTDYSDWRLSQYENSNIPLLNLLRADNSIFENKTLRSKEYRWRAKVDESEATFNYQKNPKKIFLSGKLVVQMQVKVGGEWINVEFDPNAVKEMSDRVRKDLNKIYYTFLKDTFDLELSAERFRGLNEE